MDRMSGVKISWVLLISATCAMAAPEDPGKTALSYVEKVKEKRLNLEPGTDGFRENLERFAANPLFVGIRSGNLWGRDFKAMASLKRSPSFIVKGR